MSLGPTELFFILLIVLLLFGATKLKSLGSDLGSAIKGFRKAKRDDEDDRSGPGKAAGSLKESSEESAASGTAEDRSGKT